MIFIPIHKNVVLSLIRRIGSCWFIFYCLNFHLHIAPHMFSLSTLKGMNNFLPYLVFSGLSHLDRLIYLYSYSYEYRYYLYTCTVLVLLGLVSFFILCLNSIECHSKLMVFFSFLDDSMFSVWGRINVKHGRGGLLISHHVSCLVCNCWFLVSFADCIESCNLTVISFAFKNVYSNPYLATI